MNEKSDPLVVFAKFGNSRDDGGKSYLSYIVSSRVVFREYLAVFFFFVAFIFRFIVYTIDNNIYNVRVDYIIRTFQLRVSLSCNFW